MLADEIALAKERREPQAIQERGEAVGPSTRRSPRSPPIGSTPCTNCGVAPVAAELAYTKLTALAAETASRARPRGTAAYSPLSRSRIACAFGSCSS
jgi:hypothetical protein